MKDDLENVKNLGTDLMAEMQKITSDFKIGKQNTAPNEMMMMIIINKIAFFLLSLMIFLQSWITHIPLLGFGSFVEKTVMPYISTTPARLINPCTGNQNCTSPFSYKNVLKLTDKGDEFNRLVSQQQISGNLDSPEGGFDAIMQVAVCGVRGGWRAFPCLMLFNSVKARVCCKCVWYYITRRFCCSSQEHIGWRDVTRLLVFSTDAGFHFAGDGKLGGIVLPNDGKCHLENNMYTMSHYYVRSLSFI